MRSFVLVFLVLTLICCKKEPPKEPVAEVIPIWDQPYQTVSLLGDTLYAASPSDSLLARYERRKKDFDENPNRLENIIWFGRFTAYKGEYREAIRIYSEGLQKFPDESRLLRHRGHRYISVREFDKAINDLSRAAELIKGKENRIEQDGMPNELGIPVSTMHGNIYYHLGLAHYLNEDMEAALAAYKKCLDTSHNPDNVVSATHWIYMILRRLDRQEEAASYLGAIREDMNVIENTSYYNACLFYKGVLPVDEVYSPESEATPANSALKYAIGNWYDYNGNSPKAIEIFREITQGSDWASFGFIAAEADLSRDN